MSSNLQASFDYVGISCKTEMGGDEIDMDNTSLAEDAAMCMYLGTQLNALHSSLCKDKQEEHCRIFSVSLLVNLLVGDGWRDGVFPISSESSDESSTQPEPQIMLAITFVLIHSLCNVAFFAVKKGEHEQRMSRAVASLLPPMLSQARTVDRNGHSYSCVMANQCGKQIRHSPDGRIWTLVRRDIERSNTRRDCLSRGGITLTSSSRCN